MAEEIEAGASVHLPFEHFRLRVDAFRSPVTVREGERGGGGLDVQVQSAGEGMELGQVSGPCPGDPLLEPLLVPGIGASMAAKEPIRAARAFISSCARHVSRSVSPRMGGLGSARRRSVAQGRRACGSSFLLGPGQALGLMHRAARHGPSRSIADCAQVDRRSGRGPGTCDQALWTAAAAAAPMSAACSDWAMIVRSERAS